MEDDDDDDHIVKLPEMNCTFCGENEYDLRAGFYFCRECGTKVEQLQDIQVDKEDKFADAKHTKKQKIKEEKPDKPQITSWECYNFILRGFVEELLNLGAKEDFKLITLQLWTAYLRRKEVAFFNTKHAELPRLGVRFHKRDANILYNHALQKRKKRKRDDASSKTSGDNSKEWRRMKRKLTESLYSTSLSEHTNTVFSTSSGTTAHAIRINFSSHARKVLKKHIPVKHIKKHESDALGILDCHQFPPKNCVKKLPSETFLAKICLRDLYAILAIALNLAEDDIQLTDLVRYIDEGHIGTKNVLKYFPENVANYGKEILDDISFYRDTEKASYKLLREHIQFMSKFIGIQEYRTPNIHRLVLRYVSDLNLPTDLAIYIERLIKILPPEMKIRPSKIYPAYEARAMAYIIFLLKLLFGLDGFKEKQISETAVKINTELDKATDIVTARQQSKLFVWHEWVEYIEMRKVIIAQYNSTYGQQFRVKQTLEQKLAEFMEINQRENEPSKENDATAGMERNADNLKRIIEEYQHQMFTQNDNGDNVGDTVSFQPSLLPSESYFKRIRLHRAITGSSSTNSTKIKIPEFMNVDHSLRTLEPYLNTRFLKEYFEALKINLDVQTLACTNNKHYVGIFVSGRDFLAREINTYKVDFDISEEEWLKNIVDEPFLEEITFKTVLDCYEKRYMKKLENQALKRQQNEFEKESGKAVASTLASENDLESDIKIENEQPTFDMLSLHSIEVFSENNMEPIDCASLNQPRRNINTINLLDGSLNVDFENTTLVKNEAESEALTFYKSEMDCWLLMGHIAELPEVKRKSLENLFPRSFKWLLETCANILNIETGVLYDQLMAIEITFAHGIKSLEDFTNFVRFEHLNRIKDINQLVNWYREIW